jgi:hypothetical protein
MKYSKLFLCLAVSVLAASPITQLRAADDAAKAATKADKAKEAKPDEGEMMKRMMEMATPGPAHKALEPLVGDFDVVSKFWMGGDESNVMESKGSVKSKWILDGRFLQEEFEGDMMGMKFKGFGLTGYDNMRKQYVSIWMDTMGTGIMKSEGTADSDNKVFTFTGKMDEPATGEKDKPVKFVTKIISNDKHTFEMYDLTLGAKSKVGEITYTRK